ncbi:MAG: T9SS type A sorting domain-containing protein [Ferruginibacter sp.]
MRKIYLVSLMIAFVAFTSAQTMSNYAGANFSATSGSFNQLAGGTTVPVLLADDVASVYLPIGFSFYYMGVAYDQVRAGSDGYLTFGASGSSITNNLATGVAVSRPVIAPFWDDMDGRGTGAQASYLTTGIAGSRVFTFEWLNWVRTGGTTPVMSFQVKLYESTGIIDYVYRSDAAALSGASVSIGLSAITTGSGNFVSLSDATAAPTTSTTTETTTITTKPATGQVYTFTPPQASVAAPTTLTFNGIYTGGMNLNWVDNSTNETDFNIFRSIDNINFTYVSTVTSTSVATTGTAYNYLATGLNASTTYYWRIVSSSEGIPSLPLEGSQATTACSISGTKLVGPTGLYSSLTQAIGVLQLNGASGPVILELQAAYTSAGETFPLTIGGISCLSATNTLTIRPEAGATNLLITNALSNATIVDSTNGSYLTIDGRPGGAGTAKELTIENTNVAGQAIKFINDATNSTIKYCTIKGVNTSTSQGVIWFTTTTGTTGNDNITIDNCDIKDGATTPVNSIYSLGTATTTAVNNSAVTISNNNIYNYFSATADHYGINLNGGNTDWTITGNSFYQTSSRAVTASNTTGGIRISNSTSGNNFNISGNYIGGTAPSCGGSAQTYTGTASVGVILRGIQLTVGTTTATSIQGNTIQNFNITTGGAATSTSGLSLLTGKINVGNITGNIIGSQSLANSIVYINAGTATTSIVSGILAGTGTGDVTLIQNNTIGGIAVSNSSTGSTSLRGIGFQGSTGIFTVTGNTIGSLITANSISNSTNNSILGIFGSASITSATQTISNNTVANLTSTSTGTTAAIIGILDQGSAGGIYNTTGNTIRNFTSSAPNIGTSGSASIVGISHTAASTAGQIVSQNSIYNLTNTSVAASNITMAGIYYSGPISGTNLVARNYIHTLSLAAMGATPIIYGINVNNGLTTFQNNMIDLGNSVVANTSIFGINDGVGTNNYFFNSVYLGGSVTNSLNCFAFNSSVTTNTRLFQNNIFVNARTNAGTGKSYAVQVAGTTANPPGLTINYNDYYTTGTGTVLGRFNSLDVATIAAWRTAVGQDANSFSADPLYVNPTAAIPDLHVSTGTPAEGTGLLIASVTDDFDGQSRASLSPTDIGADAGDYALVGLDMGAIALVSPAITGCYTATETVTVTIKNFSATTIDFSVNNVTVTVTATGGYSSNIVLTSGTLAGGGTQNVTLPATIDLTANGAYTFNLSATVSGDLNTANDAIAVIRTVSILSGTKTVGATGADYTTLTAAVAAYNSASCISSPVVFELISTYASVGETFPIVINANPAAGTNTLTIRPAAATAVTITGTSGAVASSLIKLNGADYIIFDGLNTGGASLTVENISATTGTAVFWLASIGTGAGATNNVIRNCNIKAGIAQNTSALTTYGVVIAGNTLSGTSTSVTAGDDNDNNTLTANNFTKLRYGIYTRGGATTNTNTGTVISSNIIGASAFGVDVIGKVGVLVREEDGIQIIGNTIQYVGGNYANTSAGSDRVAIDLGTDAAWSGSVAPTSVSVKNAVITKNVIHDIVEERTFTAAGIIISVADGSNATNNLVANNMISNVKANGTAGDQAIGIGLSASNTDKIVYNSIYMAGDTDPDALATTPTVSNYGISVSTTSVTNLSLIDNIVFMDLTSSSDATIKNATINIPAAYVWGTGSSNYNDYYVDAANTQSNIGSVGGSGGTYYATLATWQAAVLQDANSISVLPVFMSATDLHLNISSNSALDNKAIVIAGVTTDIDGQVRGIGVVPAPTAPDMGADEFTGSPVPITIEFFRGAKQTAGNLLDWKVSCTSTPFATLTLERSADGRNFFDVNTQQATSLRCLSPFSYVDAAPLPGINYYRLKMTDADGKITYSHLVVIINKGKGFEIVGLSPNPVYNTANLNLTTAASGKIEVQITDINGKLLQRQSVQLQSGSNLVPLKVSNLVAGSYQVTVITEDGEKTSIRFIKQ